MKIALTLVVLIDWPDIYSWQDLGFDGIEIRASGKIYLLSGHGLLPKRNFPTPLRN